MVITPTGSGFLEIWWLQRISDPVNVPQTDMKCLTNLPVVMVESDWSDPGLVS